MPLDRSHRLTDQSITMENPEDIALVFDALRRIPHRGFFTKERAQSDVAEEIAYQLLLRPGWIRPHVPDLVRAGVADGMTFDWLCLLMHDAPDSLIDDLIAASRSGETSNRLRLLLASRRPAAMEAVARFASSNVDAARECRELGFHLPASGPAQPRFAQERRALRLLPGISPVGAPHAVGLSLTDVLVPGDDRIAFHYLSLTPALIPGMPAWEGQAHIVAPRHWPDWTLIARARDDGRLQVVDLRLGDDRSLDEELADILDAAAATAQTSAAVEVIPFDDDLLYANQHPLSTPNVVGVVGGPPIGLADAPICPECERLMFHVGQTDTHAREYGDGFRSLFVCEDCRTCATLATLWN